MTRLYWLGRNGLWKHVKDWKEEVNMRVEAQRRLGMTKRVGIVGYCVITEKYSDGWKTFWYMYVNKANGYSRSLVRTSEVPKPIRLLEMFHETHATG